MEKLIVKPAFTGHQKIMLIGFFLLFFFVGLSTIIWYLLYAMGRIESDNPYSSSDLITALLFLLSFVLLAAAIAKEGLTIDHDRVYKSIFLFKRHMVKTEVDISGFTDISILGQSLSQKYAFGASPDPDKAYSFKEYRIYLLSKSHSKKTLLLSCKTLAEANELLEKISSLLNLQINKYQPPRSNKKRR